VFGYTFLFPVLMAFLFVKLNLIQSIFMHTKRERIYPFLLTIIVYATIAYRFNELPYPVELNMVLITATISLLAAFVINLVWKISVHTIGIAGLAGILYYGGESSNFNIMLPFIVVVLFAGAVGTARLLITDHTKEQVIAGYAVGWMSAGLAYWWVA